MANKSLVVRYHSHVLDVENPVRTDETLGKLQPSPLLSRQREPNIMEIGSNRPPFERNFPPNAPRPAFLARDS